MNIEFIKIKAHGFLSLGDIELDLKDRGYCLVNGINNNPKDAAKSNGSGKSSLWSAICWALTGETIQGLRSNIVNIHIKDGCYVELDFKLNNILYKIIRYKDYARIGTDLKIYKDGVDCSGKGIRESEALLEQYIPDINADLLGNIIILGQGLPHKFSDNSPSGRKEVLEKLSRSDFMIQDIKDRIERRTLILSQNIRKFEDNILTTNSHKSIYLQQLDIANNNLKILDIEVDYDTKIKEEENNKHTIEEKIDLITNNLNSLNEKNNFYNEQNLKLVNDKNEGLNKIKNDYDSKLNSNLELRYNLNSKINSLNQEITALDNIKEICPTCGQKIPNVSKPDTTNKKLELEALKTELNKLVDAHNLFKEQYQQEQNLFNNNYIDKFKELEENHNLIKNSLKQYKENLDDYKTQLLNINNNLNKLKLDKENHFNNLNKLKEEIELLKTNIEKAEASLVYNNNEKELLQEKLDVVNKITTLVKRDFRGFLLTNVIEFINFKAKEYCRDVFDTNEIEFKLEGNNINIEFCGKSYESLSGGEKQKINLIIQTSIRDMLCQYLDFHSNILVLDEITDSLDSVGCDKILSLIAKRLIDVESIFIISHRARELEIPYDSEITIIKDESGISRIKQ